MRRRACSRKARLPPSANPAREHAAPMIRVALFLILLGLIALGITWLADRPGRGRRHLAWLADRDFADGVDRHPRGADRGLHSGLVVPARILPLAPPDRAIVARTPRPAGPRAITKGLIAIGAGDARAARRYSGEASKLAAGEPLALLLGAQSAQLVGDRNAAEKSFRSMARATTPSCSGCAGCSSRRSAATMPAAQACMRRKRRASRRPCRGPGRRCCNSAAAPATGPARSTSSNATAAAARSTERPSTASARSFSPRGRWPRRTATATPPRPMSLEAVKLAPELVPAAALAGRFLSEAGETAESRAHDREGLAGLSASRSRRDLRASAIRRFAARSSDARAAPAGQASRRHRGRARA